MVKAYICSPYRGPTEEAVKENVQTAARFAKIALEKGWFPVVPHLFTQAIWGLDTSDPHINKIVTEFNFKLLKDCAVLIQCGDRVTSGMQEEIDWCKANNIPILRYDENN